MFRQTAVFVVVALVLAGCAKPPSDGSDPDCSDAVLCNPEQYFGDHFCEKNDVHPRVYAPDTQGPDSDANPWVLGDWWEYQLELNGEDLGTTRLVYYDIQDQGAHYMVGTPTREEALQHALFSTNPVIGRIHKTLYSPHEAGEHADMFNFPLCQGNTWNAIEARPEVFFATEFRFAASHDPVVLPDGTTDPLGFSIRGVGVKDSSRISHTYSHAAKWFTQIDVERADGMELSMSLVDFGSGARGNAFFLRGQQDEAFSLSGAGSQQITFDRPPGGSGAYDTLGVFLDFQRASGDARVEAVLMTPDGERVACVGASGSGALGGGAKSGDCIDVAQGPQMLEVPFVPGTWTLEYGTVNSFGSNTQVAGELRVASIYDRSGKL